MINHISSITLRYGVSFNISRGICYVDDYERPDGKRVVVVTEPKDNPGPSVTNAIEEIATDLRAEGYEWDWLVEHYTDRYLWGPDDSPETWDLVGLDWEQQRYHSPRWESLGQQKFSELILGNYSPGQPDTHSWLGWIGDAG